MNRNYAEKKLTLNYEIGFVKQCITEVIEAGRLTYTGEKMNDVLGTYKFNTGRGLLGAQINISISEINEAKTELNINAKNLYGSKAPDATLESMMDEFLNVFSLALSGETVTQETVRKNTSGCLVLLLIGMSGFVAYLLL